MTYSFFKFQFPALFGLYQDEKLPAVVSAAGSLNFMQYQESLNDTPDKAAHSVHGLGIVVARRHRIPAPAWQRW